MMAGALATRAPPGSNARAEAACAAPAPAIGALLAGSVLQVMDGETLCVALGPTPAQWVKVQLAEASSGDRVALMDAVFGRRVSCVVIAPATGGGVIAHCVTAEAAAETRQASAEAADANRRCVAAD
jgi:regulator of extracellular matrix RemA (YlzA/DUF370 family)